MLFNLVDWHVSKQFFYPAVSTKPRVGPVLFLLTCICGSQPRGGGGDECERVKTAKCDFTRQRPYEQSNTATAWTFSDIAARSLLSLSTRSEYFQRRNTCCWQT